MAWSLAAAFFAGYAALAVSQHLRLRTTGYDLGIFEQAVRGYARLHAPVSSLKGPGFNLLGDHFHPVLAVLAPLYRVFPSPLTLLVAQAALLAVSVVPVTRAAVGATGARPGAAVGVAYGLSWGLQRAVGFDFHEVAFAVPLLAWSLEALLLRRWRAVVGWAVPLMLVKEDLPLTVAAVGCCLGLYGQRRRGLLLAVSAVACGVLEVGFLIPAFNPHGRYPYLASATGGQGFPLLRLLLPWSKAGTVMALLAPTSFLALRSPLLLVAVPTLAWRFWSANPVYWGLGHHYNAVLMPVVFLAFADALTRLRGARWRSAAVAVALSVAGGFTVVLPLRDLAWAAWQPSPWAPAAARLAAEVPDGARIGVANALAPQLTARADVYRFPQQLDSGPLPEWLLVSDPDRGGLPVPGIERGRLPLLPALGYRLVDEEHGLLLYRRER